MRRLDAIRARADAATSGPWVWTGNLYNRSVELSTRHSGRLGVMRFVRWGMNSAQPLFLDVASLHPDRMMGVTTQKASDLPVFEVAPEATSRHDKGVYRTDIIGIRHPDAEFLAHSRTDVDRLLLVALAGRRVIDESIAADSERVYVSMESWKALVSALAPLEADEGPPMGEVGDHIPVGRRVYRFDGPWPDDLVTITKVTLYVKGEPERVLWEGKGKPERVLWSGPSRRTRLKRWFRRLLRREPEWQTIDITRLVDDWRSADVTIRED